ncbi:helix-turn-helix domain-containing protein [Aequorivita sp. Q41]|uniref:helix-turn-helix domain-containing protein n=1 Tax=Aequorivita sp. Q41 TaxID=3153300 RepID=UPI00324241D8
MSQKANSLIDRLKSELSVKKDKDLCDMLGIKHNTLSTWKKRDTLDFNKVLELCERNNLDLNFIFFEEEDENTKAKPQESLIAEKRKSKLSHFFSASLVNKSSRISIFYNQLEADTDKNNGEILVCQKVSLKKITKNKLYVFEDILNTIFLDTLVLVKEQGADTSKLYLSNSNKNFDLKTIVNAWQVLEKPNNITNFIGRLNPLGV